MVNAGWYQDPSDPVRQRYWDGAQWTEHVQAPPSAGFQQQPPIAYGQPVYATTPQAVAIGAEKPIGPGFGAWFGATFRGFFKGLLGSVGLFAVVTIPFAVLGYALLYSVLNGMILGEDRFGDPVVDDFTAGSALYGLGAVYVVAILLQWVGLLGSQHYMYQTHMGNERSLVGSLLAGIKALPKYLLLFLGLMVGYIVLIGGVTGLTALAGESSVLAVVSILLIICLYIGVIYVAIRLAYIPLTATVGPQGQGFIRAAWDASRGRFWAILGRTYLMSFFATIFLYIGLGIVVVIGIMILPYSFDPDGGLLVDGSPVDLAQGVPITDYLPSVGVASIILVLFTLALAIQNSFLASNNAVMYIQDQDAAKLRR